MSKGIFVAKAGKNIDDGDLLFDSTKKHLQINLNANPKHFNTARIVGTALPQDGALHSETLLSIPHGYNYVPKREAYLFSDGDNLFNFYAGRGSYGRNKLFLATSVTRIDYFEAGVDATNFYVKHYFQASTGGVSTAPANPINLKYYIFANPAQD